jgi:protein-L-isoaspartate(D-aspartate) O-methyltransferase
MNTLMNKGAFLIYGALVLAIVSAAAAGAAPSPTPDRAGSVTEAMFNYQGYVAAMKAGGRELGGLTERDFSVLQARKTAMMSAITSYLKKYAGGASETVLNAFRQVPREYFMYDYQKGKNLGASAYENPIREWPIGYGSTLSDYLVQAYMTQTLDPKPTDVSLEIGTGSGFQSSILSRIVKEDYTIELITALGQKVQNIFPPLGYTNIHTRIGDGFYGWPEVKDGFDIIMVTAAAPFVPPALLAQLKKGGRMIIPIGQPYRRQFLYFFTKDQDGKVHSRKDISVLFIPMRGQVQMAAQG